MKKIVFGISIVVAAAQAAECPPFEPRALDRRVSLIAADITTDEVMDLVRKADNEKLSTFRRREFMRCLQQCTDQTEQRKAYCAFTAGRASCFTCVVCTKNSTTMPGIRHVAHRDSLLGCYDDETPSGTFVMYGPCSHEQAYPKRDRHL